MGQYFKALVIEKNEYGKLNKVEVVNPRSYNSFSKLTESYYVGNHFVNAVMGMIENCPKQVAWIGDYSDDEYGDPYESKIPHEQFMPYYNAAWRDENDIFIVKPEPMEFEVTSEGWYLVNHTQKMVLSLDDFIRNNKWLERYYDMSTKDTKEDYWCVNPLPLLTACGNGRGGGDYSERQPDHDKVGTWAFDLIELTKEKPEGFADVMYGFREILYSL